MKRLRIIRLASLLLSVLLVISIRRKQKNEVNLEFLLKAEQNELPVSQHEGIHCVQQVLAE